MKELLEIFRAEEFILCRDEINENNRLALHVLSVVGIPVSLTVILAQSIIKGMDSLSLKSGMLLAYFVLLLIVERKALPWQFRYSTLVLYLIQIPPILVTILLGTVWDPGHQALTYLMFLVAMPVFILDRPVRVIGYSVAWSLLFLSLCLLVKDPSTHKGDFFHLLEFFLTSMVVTCVTLSVRLSSLRGLLQARYHLEHDSITGLRNRKGLEGRKDGYLRKDLIVLMAGLDQLNLYNDFYGRDTGNEILMDFSAFLTEAFGEDNCFRYGGDEILCLARGTEEDAFLRRLDAVRDRLKLRRFGDTEIRLSFAAGYTTGCPETDTELERMIRMADIYGHRCRSQGRNQTLGTPYDPERYHSAVSQSGFANHIRPYELNSLTGLPNLSFFMARTDELLSHAMDRARCPMIGYFSLKRFRDYNDRYGYAAGDALLRFVAGALKECFSGRPIGYISGSRFAVACYRDEAEPAMERLRAALREYLKGRRVEITAGFAEYDGETGAIATLDHARLAQKNTAHGAKLRFYDETLGEEIRFRHYIIDHVEEAVERGWLKVYYQPIARAVTGEICNEEAVSRWDDPVYGFLGPDRFIPPLEENHLIYKLTLHVVRQVLADSVRRRELGVPVVPVSVNLSRFDLEQCDMPKEISALVDASGFPRSQLRIEITESAFVENSRQMIREVNRFRQMGFEVWMDDFGSEYSTLNLLQELNFDLIKIDMKFMESFAPGSKNRIIVSDIIDMARRMGVTTLIEGIETREQFELLRDMGCEKIQGFLFNCPNPLDYITRRALSGTGLRFEDPREAAYYSAIGRIDLNAPVSRSELGTEAVADSMVASGIVEKTAEGFSCIRGNRPFFRLLSAMGWIPPECAGERTPLSGAACGELERAAEGCRESAEWAMLNLPMTEGGPAVFHMRRVSADSVTGALALLMIHLPTQSVSD